MAKNYTVDQVMAAVRSSGGIIDCVAARLGCCWVTARDYINKYPEAKDALEIEQSKLNALACSKLVEAVRAGDERARDRVLETSARRNGFGTVNRQEISGPDGSPIQQNVAQVIDIGSDMIKGALMELAAINAIPVEAESEAISEAKPEALPEPVKEPAQSHRKKKKRRNP